MKVKIMIEFDVTTDVDDAEFTKEVARAAASLAAYDYLSFTKVSGYSRDSDSVCVHVDGFGDCDVAIGQDHE